jgi:hypothetical protein
MTQIANYRAPSAGQGPRGIQGHNQGGAYSRDSQEDLVQSDAFHGGPEVLSGTTDAIAFPYVPTFPQSSTNFIIATAGVDAITLAAPRNPNDDNQSVAIYSDTANAHTVTMPSALFATGAGLHSLATFAAQRGAGMLLRAYNGTWQVIASSGVTFSA